jgi:hypothetical protein
MNPKKLPRLRPSPQQRWEIPVGTFIEGTTESGSAERLRKMTEFRSLK